MVQKKYSEKATSPNKRKRKKEKGKKKKEKRKRKKHVWLSGRLHIDGRLDEVPRLKQKHRDENEAKQKPMIPPKRFDIFPP